MHNQLFSLSSVEIDHHFGLRINEIEHELLNSARALRPNGSMKNFGEVLHVGHQTWVGLDPQVLNTPYQELVQMCELLRPVASETVVDLGAGYGRLGLVLHHMCPEVRFKGYELVKERVEEGNRVFEKIGCTLARLFTQDLTSPDFHLPVADYYFLYDYGKVSHIRSTMTQLEHLADHHHFKVVARGKGSRSIIEYEHPWLSQLNPVHHEEHFSIYSF